MSSTSGKHFLDTNVFLYSFDRTSDDKRAVAQALIRRAFESQDGVISSQVVQEFLNAATRKLKEPMRPADRRRYLDAVLLPLCEVFPSADLYRAALRVQDESGYAFYDALIVAAALAAGCRTLYSEDLQDGQTIDGLTIRNPFTAPSARSGRR